MGDLSLDAVWSRYQRAKQRRRCWESLWRECYTFALPQRGDGFGAEFRPGANPAERLFDGTALDGVEQLAASPARGADPALVAVVRPHPRARDRSDRARRGRRIPRGVTQTLQAHFDRSNFAVEIHQAFLDLVAVGNATLLFEEAPVGGLSAFRLSAVPMSEIAFEAGPDGQIDGHFRERSLPLDLMRARFPDAALPEPGLRRRQRAERRGGRGGAAADGAFAYLALLRRRRAARRCSAAAASTARRSSPSAGSRVPARSTAARR